MKEVKEFVIKIECECDEDIDAWTMANLIENMVMDKINCTECSYDVEQTK